jgi:hypothetical protein
MLFECDIQNNFRMTFQYRFASTGCMWFFVPHGLIECPLSAISSTDTHAEFRSLRRADRRGAMFEGRLCQVRSSVPFCRGLIECPVRAISSTYPMPSSDFCAAQTVWGLCSRGAHAQFGRLFHFAEFPFSAALGILERCSINEM